MSFTSRLVPAVQSSFADAADAVAEERERRCMHTVASITDASKRRRTETNDPRPEITAKDFKKPRWAKKLHNMHNLTTGRSPGPITFARSSVTNDCVQLPATVGKDES